MTGFDKSEIQSDASLNETSIDTSNNEDISTEVDTEELVSLNETEKTNNNDIDNEEETFAMSDEEFLEFYDKQINNSKETKSNKETKDTSSDASELPVIEDKVKDNINTSEEAKIDPEANKEQLDVKEKEVDYKNIYETIFKPFKANGKEVKVDTTDDVIKLMQMGANYVKKMQVIKPMRKTIQTLEDNKIDESTLNFLIDIHKGDKEAIKELIKKNSIDPLEIDLDEINYLPKQHTASDESVNFSLVLDDIKDSPTFNKTQDIVMKQWDEVSRKKVLTDAKMLKALHEEVELGRYDVIQPMVDRARILGHIPHDMSSYDAYVVLLKDYINTETAKQEKEMKTNSTNSKPKVDTIAKRAAAPTTANKANITKIEEYTKEDILGMSDEEFNKLNLNNLLR